MATDMSERGFENEIINWLVEENGYELGRNETYNKNYALDEWRLFRYLQATQPRLVEELRLLESPLEKQNFLSSLEQQIFEKGVLEILQSGFRYKYKNIYLYQRTASAGNKTAAEMYEKNIFSVTRQLHYSNENRNSLDVAIFLNGLPIITMELKNNYTHSNTKDAVYQYKKDRLPTEKLFNFKRCIVHFAVDDEEIFMCTKLEGMKSRFMPFNKGNNDGAGNPPHDGTKTDYLWKEILTKAELSNIIEKFAQIVKDKGKVTQIFPRYHQLKVVEKLLKLSQVEGVGHRYLIQHSAGSGKSNSIAWLALQLCDKKIFDTVIVVTDRINLDRQIQNTILKFTQNTNVIGWAHSSKDLGELLARGKTIIITIVHKFQRIAQEINSSYKNKKFAVIIDEAHSSQNGSLAAKMNQVISGINYAAENDIEDQINAIIESKKSARNASYFAFTATPKNKTLELFGKKTKNGQSVPHDIYSMKQAIEEGFILDVLKNYTPYKIYRNIVRTTDEEKYFDKRTANKILLRYADNHELAISHKAEIIVEHFYNNVRMKIQGAARAMVVTSSIQSAIEYYFAVTKEFAERGSEYKAVVAFSGEFEYNGETYTEATLNNFPSSQIEKVFRKNPYRILIVADKFQTGYDEPLLHTMYVDKKLSDIKAVQTLSRLNRTAENKTDTCILDFANNPAEIEKAFNRYYKATILSGETDINRLNELIDEMTPLKVFTSADVESVVNLYLNDGERAKIDSVINYCVENYKALSTVAQIDFKSNAKSFVRTYNFLTAIMPCNSPAWEKLSIFLTLLIMKLPRPAGDEDEGLIESVNLESYRAEAKTKYEFALQNENAVVAPAPVPKGGIVSTPKQDTLTKILEEFHRLFGDIEWQNQSVMDLQIRKIFYYALADSRVQSAAASSDAQNLRSEINRSVGEAVISTVKDGGEVYTAYNSGTKNKFGLQFNSWLNEAIFQASLDGV